MSKSHTLLLKVVVKADNVSQAVEATKCLSNDEEVESVEVISPEVVQSLSDFLPHVGTAVEAAKIDNPDAAIKLGLAFLEDLRTLLGHFPYSEPKSRYIVTCKHDSLADGEAKSFKHYEDAMEHAIRFWESYELGYDEHLEEPFYDPEGAPSDVEVVRDKDDRVLSVVHADGDGPVILIQLEST